MRKKRDCKSRKRRVSELQEAVSAASRTKQQRCTTSRSYCRLYAPEDAVLVVGDGDFSFSRGLIKHRGTGRGVLATSFDSESKVKRKYSSAKDCITAVWSSHGIVVHDVDATKLHEMPRQVKTAMGLMNIPDFFQYIVFNFPHSGEQRVHINRALLRNFFESARTRLMADGEVHVTLKTRPPYSNWFIEDQAKTAGFVVKERRKLDMSLFPGYRHRTTDPQAKEFEPHLCVTYVFVVNRSKYPFLAFQADPGAADAQPAAMYLSEQHNLAAAIVNIAEAKAAASANDRSQIRHIAKKNQVSTKTASEDPNQLKINKGRLWKPVHRRDLISYR